MAETACDTDALRRKLEELNILDEALLQEQKDLLSNASSEMAIRFFETLLTEKQKLAEKEQELAEKEQELAEKNLENQTLKQELKAEKSTRLDSFQLPAGVVSSVSVAAEKRRDEYYAEILEEQPIRGGFVAHSIFIRFIKGARGKHERRDNAKESFKKRAEELVKALENRKEESFLSSSKADLEAPQSLVASQLLSMALDAWQRHVHQDHYPPLVFFSHQGEIKRDKIPENQIISGNSQSSNAGRTVDYKVDVMASLISEGMMKIIATVEYKPDKKSPLARMAQRDMYATNTIFLHRRVCIGIDIAGGNKVEDWEINAMAYFAAPKKKDEVKFECSNMYHDSGLDALFSVAGGIYQAAKEWDDRQNSTEQRLGPVVARHNERVLKAYVNPTYRQPNLHIVKEMLRDETASVWDSHDGNVQILDMEYKPSNWNGCVPVKIFVDILEKLNKLHEGGHVHGDIRLANLLHNKDEGFIIDFDFVGRDCYPYGLKKLPLDGGRHPDVNNAIDANTISSLRLETKHDIYSLGKVMDLFSCRDASESWKSAIDACLNNCSIGEIRGLLEVRHHVTLGGNKEIVGDLPLFETGPTPEKPRASSVSSRSPMPSCNE